MNKNARKWPNFPRINSRLRIDSWTPQCQLSQTIVKWKHICFPKWSELHRHGAHSPYRWLCDYIHKYNILAHSILQARFQRHSTRHALLGKSAWKISLGFFFFFNKKYTWLPSPWVTQSSPVKLIVKWDHGRALFGHILAGLGEQSPPWLAVTEGMPGWRSCWPGFYSRAIFSCYQPRVRGQSAHKLLRPNFTRSNRTGRSQGTLNLLLWTGAVPYTGSCEAPARPGQAFRTMRKLLIQ